MKIFKTLAIAILTIYMLQSCNDKEALSPYIGKVKFETISVSGKIAGRLSKIYVEEGQIVNKGDTLAIIDIPEVNAKVMQANGAITAAQGQLDMANNGATKDQINQIDGQLNSGRAQLEFAKESYNRMLNMYKDSLISKQQFDEVEMKLEMAQAQVEALNAKRKEATSGARSEQIDQAQGQLQRALGAKEEVLSASKEKYMIAPTNMSIETISLKEGELLSPGFVLFNGYARSSLYFRFTVPESNIYNFEVGKELVLVNPYTEQEIKAKVKSIKQLAQYADITSTAPLYDLSESIYELKVVPTSINKEQSFFANATVIIKQ